MRAALALGVRAWPDAFPDLPIDRLDHDLAEWLAHGHLAVLHYKIKLENWPVTERTLADREVRIAIESTIAMGRVGQAREIANAILWLLSDEASFISGVTLDASGGGFVFGKR